MVGRGHKDIEKDVGRFVGIYDVRSNWPSQVSSGLLIMISCC